MTDPDTAASSSPGDLTLRTYEEAAEDYRRHRRNEVPPPIRALIERVVALAFAPTSSADRGNSCGPTQSSCT